MKKNQIPALDFRIRLQTEFEARRKRNGAYSIRSFARFLGIDHSVLAKLMTGKRALGPALIRKLGRKIGMPADEIQRFEQARRERRRLGTTSNDRYAGAHRILSARELKSISNWYDYALLELMDLRGFRMDTGLISRVLKISEEKASESIAGLTRAGIIQLNSQGKWVKTPGQTTVAPDDPETQGIREQLILAVMQKALSSLSESESESRSHTAMTFAIDSSLLPQAVEKIRHFRLELSRFLNENRKTDRVYQLAVALYPLSEKISQET